MNATPTIPPPRPDPVSKIRQLLGDAVLLRCVGKRPVAKGWQNTKLADMTPEYLTSLRGSNIGVLLGPPSGGLCVIDLDDSALVQPFLDANPLLASSFRTHGARGCSFWVRFQGDYPKESKSLGAGVGEYRASGNQSIVYGTHPDTKRPYEWVVRQPPVTVNFRSIVWPKEVLNPPGTAEAKPPLESSPTGTVPIGAAPIGGPLYPCGGAGVAGGVPLCPCPLSPEGRAEMDGAVERGAKATKQNNEASFRAAQELILSRGLEDLSAMPQEERRYFAESWYAELARLGRTHKPKTHYMQDMFNAIRNAKRSNMKNPLPEALRLARANPLPPEAKDFDGDETMQTLIAMCYHLHSLSGGGEWFLPRDKVGQLLGLGPTETRDLGENFNVLVELGVLEVVSPPDKEKRRATVYRWKGGA